MRVLVLMLILEEVRDYFNDYLLHSDINLIIDIWKVRLNKQIVFLVSVEQLINDFIFFSDFYWQILDF